MLLISNITNIKQSRPIPISDIGKTPHRMYAGLFIPATFIDKPSVHATGNNRPSNRRRRRETFIREKLYR